MQNQHRIFQQEKETSHAMQQKKRNRIWVQIPYQSPITGHAIETCLQSLIQQITSDHRTRHVTGLKINKQDRALEIHFEEEESS